MDNQHHPHFLLVTFGFKGHINPTLNLAGRLTHSPFCIPVTVATPISTGSLQNLERDDLLSYSQYSDGSEDCLDPTSDRHIIKLRMKESISGLILDLAADGRQVTYIVYTILLEAAAEVASELGIPSALLWIQPATVFTINYRYFHGYHDLIVSHEEDPMYPVQLPGLPSLKICDLPSYLTTDRSESSSISFLHLMFEDMFRTLDQVGTGLEYRYPVLVNTFEELEPDLLLAGSGMELIPVGPLVTIPESRSDESYMQWLDSKDEGSVVYVSFGSLAKLSRTQNEEMSRGLVDSGRPYLWVLRKDNGDGDEEVRLGEGEMGMVVEWCSQVRVLAHRSVGCFVTHCGWNSTLEGLVCGVPMVTVPQWVDQPTNARMADGEWGVGVRAVGEEEGVVEGKELKRCVDVVMGEGGEEMRERAKIWGEKGRKAVEEGGSSFRNLEAFLGISGLTRI